MADPTAPAASPLERANAWYLQLLEREAAAAGRPVAAAGLAEHLRLLPADGETPREGAPLRLGANSRLSACTIRLNATTGETLSWYLDFLAVGCDGTMLGDDALALATSVADPPDGAVLTESGYEYMAGRNFYRARWKHVVDGIPVEGDYIEVLVNGKYRKAFSYAKVWREPRVGAPPQVR